MSACSRPAARISSASHATWKLRAGPGGPGGGSSGWQMPAYSAVSLRLGARCWPPTEAGAVEDQRARDRRAGVTRRRRRPSGAGIGREYRPSPSTTRACLARSPGPRPDQSDVRRPCTGGPSRRRDRIRRRTARPGAAGTAFLSGVLGHLALGLPVRVRIAQPPAVGEGELLQVGAVPTGERVIDGVGELFEGVAARCREDPPGPRPVLLSVAFD